MRENKMVQVSFYVSKHHKDKIRNISKAKHLPMSRLMGLLLDRELSEADRPLTFDFTLAGEEAVESAYQIQGGLILNYLAKNPDPIGIDLLSLFRFEIGVPEMIDFLGGINELIQVGMIEGLPPVLVRNQPPLPDGYLQYVVKGSAGSKKRNNKLMSKDAKDFEKYQKLKNKFKGVE